MARPKKEPQAEEKQKEEVKSTAETIVVKEVVEKVVEKLVEKRVSPFSDQEALFLQDFLKFTHSLYNESNSVSVRTKLQTFNRLIERVLADESLSRH
jgi:hypothetical protein